MERFLVCMALAASTIAQAEVISQRAIEIAGDNGFIERRVKIPDFNGKEVIVTQIMKPNADGSFTYIHGLQPRETQEFDNSFCTLQGGTLKSDGETIWGSETLMGVYCESHGDNGPKAGIRANGVWLQPLTPPGRWSRVFELDVRSGRTTSCPAGLRAKEFRRIGKAELPPSWAYPGHYQYGWLGRISAANRRRMSHRQTGLADRQYQSWYDASLLRQSRPLNQHSHDNLPAWRMRDRYRRRDSLLIFCRGDFREPLKTLSYPSSRRRPEELYNSEAGYPVPCVSTCSRRWTPAFAGATIKTEVIRGSLRSRQAVARTWVATEGSL